MSRSLTILFCLFTLFSEAQVVMSELPDQVIGREGSFDEVSLNDFVSIESFYEVSFLVPETQDVRPSWTVNTSSFQFEMTVTAIVESKGESAIGADHLLAVVDGNGNIRSVGSAVEVGDNWVYFLTVYSNENSEELSFKFFDDDTSQIINSKETFTFGSNDVLGEPDDPYKISVSNISYALTDDVLSFSIDDVSFVGEERLLVVARNLSDPNDFDQDTLTLEVADDYTPLLVGIPDQVSNFGEAFTSFDLDDFTSLQDGDPISFSFAGNSELQVAIDEENVITVTKPADWSGTETVTFTVTDQSANSFSSSQAVSFTGKAQDVAPVISTIEDKTTGIGGFFESIRLNDFVTTPNPKAIKWEVSFITDSMEAAPNWSVNANEFQFDMTVTAKVTALGKTLTGSSHKLAAFSTDEDKVVGVSSAIEVNNGWFFFLTINGNTEGDSIYFKVFDTVSERVLPISSHILFEANKIEGDPLDPFEMEAGYIFTEIVDSELLFTLLETKWIGVERLKLTATDTATAEQLSEADTIQLEVLNLTPPVLDPIPNQSIDEGTAFSSIDISTYLRNLTFEEVTVEITGADTLSPVLNNSSLSFSVPNNDFFGKDKVRIKVTSSVNANLADAIDVELNVINVNDAPVITTSPPETVSIGNLYQYNLLANDVDFDELTYSVEGLPNWLFFVPNTKGVLILGVPTNDDAGEYMLDISVSDGQKITSQQIELVVSLAQIGELTNQTIEEGGDFDTIDLDDFLDIIGQVATYWEVAGGTDLTVSLNVENELSVQAPNEDWFGSESITIRLLDSNTDELHDELTLIYEVINVNDAPIISTTAPTNAAIGSLYQYNLEASDIDLDALTFTVDNLPSWLVFTPNSSGASIVGTPKEDDAGEYTFQVEVSDGVLSVKEEINLVVSLVKINTISKQIIKEGGTFQAIDLDSFLVIVGAQQTYWQVNATGELLASLDDQNVLYVTTPHEDWFGEEVIQISLVEAGSDVLLDDAEVVFQVTNINDAPVFLSNPSTDLDSKSQLQVKTIVEDVDGDALTFSLQDAPEWLTLFSEIDGFTLFGIPALASEVYTFTVIADDGTIQTTQSVELNVTHVLSVMDEQMIHVYPNPVSDVLNVTYQGEAKLKIYSLSGALIMEKPFINDISLSIKHLKNDIYLIEVENDESSVLQKLIKTN